MIWQGPVPEGRLARIQDLNFVSFFVSYILMHFLGYHSVLSLLSRSKGSSVFCNLELHVLRRENVACNVA